MRRATTRFFLQSLLYNDGVERYTYPKGKICAVRLTHSWALSSTVQPILLNLKAHNAKSKQASNEWDLQGAK